MKTLSSLVFVLGLHFWPLAAGAADILVRENVVAWCIVPFDARKRGPEERAAMLERLRITKLAYDWRDEHVKDFEAEIVATKARKIEYFAFWGEHPDAFPLFEKHGLHPQIWMTAPSPEGATNEEKVAAAVKQLLPLVKRAGEFLCPFGLYNHGGWGGEPENLVAVAKKLREAAEGAEVGIVYNFHHGHGHIEDFPEVLALMKPYLICVNLSGMNKSGEPKILALGKGEAEAAMVVELARQGYDGPIGIIDHREGTDSESTLAENLEGLKKLQEAIGDRR